MIVGAHHAFDPWVCASNGSNQRPTSVDSVWDGDRGTMYLYTYYD